MGKILCVLETVFGGWELMGWTAKRLKARLQHLNSSAGANFVLFDKPIKDVEH